jgi:hypothetical protein
MGRAPLAALVFPFIALPGLPDRLAFAAWSSDPMVNLPVCTVTGAQTHVRATTDGEGGAIITWRDERAGASSSDIYAQRVDAGGNLLWSPVGVPVDASAGIQVNPQIASDGAGGAYILWQDNAATPDRARLARVDGAGNPVWASSLTLSTGVWDAVVNNYSRQLVEDGTGGAIAVWHLINGEVYAERVDPSGNPLWGPRLVVSAANSASLPAVAADGSGGAVVCWRDFRTFVAGDGNVYAQKLDASGVPQWTANGDSVTTAAREQSQVAIAYDGAGGAIVAWNDQRNGVCDLYARRMDATGNGLWAPTGVFVGPISGFCGNEPSHIAADGTGGAILAWENNVDIKAQRLDASGSFLWGPSPVEVCVAGGPQTFLELLADVGGGALIAWVDKRITEYSIFAQQLDPSGIPQWLADGDTVSWGQGTLDVDIVPVGPGQMIAAFTRGLYPSIDIYAQLFPVGPTVDVPTLSPSTELKLSVFPNPSMRGADLQLSLSRESRVSLSIFDAGGRRVRDVLDGSLPAGVHAIHWDGRGGDGRRAPAGLYFARATAGEGVRLARVVVLGQ